MTFFVILFGSSVVAGVLGALLGLGGGVIIVPILAPIVRAALSVFFFLFQRDWLYVGFTLFVLAVLAFSLFSGIG